jgi:hypothetical protein
MTSYTLVNDCRFRISSTIASFLNPDTMEMVDNTEHAKTWLNLHEDTEIIMVASSQTPDAYFMVVKVVEDADDGDGEVVTYSGIVLRAAQFQKLEANSVLTNSLEVDESAAPTNDIEIENVSVSVIDDQDKAAA